MTYYFCHELNGNYSSPGIELFTNQRPKSQEPNSKSQEPNSPNEAGRQIPWTVLPYFLEFVTCNLVPIDRDWDISNSEIYPI